MARNYIQPGAVFDYANDTGVAISSGDVVPMGSAIGVAIVDIAIGGAGSVQSEGVFSLPKGDTAIGQGDPLIWDASAGVFEKVGDVVAATGDISNTAVAFSAAAAGDATVQVKLTGAPGTVTA